jgi:predicted rRNA methylase YqxC with S4 and FtsJ domains
MAKKARVDEMTVQQGVADDLETARKLIMSRNKNQRPSMGQSRRENPG